MDDIDLSMYEDDDIITDDSCTKSEGRIQKFFARICKKYNPDLTIHSFCYAWKKTYGDDYYSNLSCKRGNSVKTPIKLQFTFGHCTKPIFTTSHDYSIKAITDKFNRDNPRQILDAMDESVRQLIFAMNNIENTFTIEQL